MWADALILWLLFVISACIFLLCRKLAYSSQVERSSDKAHCSTSRHVFRFRLKTLLVFFLLFGAVFAVGYLFCRDAWHQRQVINRIHSFGGSILYDFQYEPSSILHSKPNRIPVSPPPNILRLLGDDLWAKVVCVLFDSNPVTDDMLGSLIVDLQDLKELHYLRIMRSRLTRKSLDNLKRLQQLRILDIKGEGLCESDITKLHQLLPTCEIIIGEKRVW